MNDNRGDALASLVMLIVMGVVWACCSDRDPKECADRCRKVGAAGSALVHFECVCFYSKETP